MLWTTEHCVATRDPPRHAGRRPADGQGIARLLEHHDDEEVRAPDAEPPESMRKTLRKLELVSGIEPLTCALRMRCSTG